ncbi:MAG TPA: dienelactone hydrolase family protein [Gemmataceae bacterium]|nr:dienelactone hydrolase family protein [Gemmataceae bacterium]
MTRWAIAMAITLTAAGAAPAAVQTKEINYESDGVKLKGFLAYDDATADKRPGVLVFPEWWGLNDYAKDRCKQLAGLGYVAFAADLYGEGKVIDTAHPEDAQKMATALRTNVKAWRGRADAALKQLVAQPNVDGTKVAAIGYCLGGSTALQLAYTGADLKAVATFHAGLMAPTPEEAKAIKARILVCNGADDKFIPEKAIADFKAALDGAGVKYEFVNFPGAVHSFTVPTADKVGNPGMKYDKAADEKSWQMMRDLFKQTLGK